MYVLTRLFGLKKDEDYYAAVRYRKLVGDLLKVQPKEVVVKVVKNIIDDMKDREFAEVIKTQLRVYYPKIEWRFKKESKKWY